MLYREWLTEQKNLVIFCGVRELEQEGKSSREVTSGMLWGVVEDTQERVVEAEAGSHLMFQKTHTLGWWGPRLKSKGGV